MDQTRPTATILLLDSEPLQRKVMAEALKRAGFVVLAVGELGAAVEELKRTPVDLLIATPYVDCIAGQEAAKYLRGKSPGMSVLFVAGFMDDERVKHRAEVEGFGLFPEPFTAAKLVDKVREILRAERERRIGRAASTKD